MQSNMDTVRLSRLSEVPMWHFLQSWIFVLFRENYLGGQVRLVLDEEESAPRKYVSTVVL